MESIITNMLAMAVSLAIPVGAITEILKAPGIINSKYIPWVSAGVGAALAAALAFGVPDIGNQPLVVNICAGLISGGLASGVWSYVSKKTTTLKDVE